METMERLAREVWKKMPKEQKKEMVFEKTGEEREDLTEAEMKELFVQIGKANTTEEAVGWLQKEGLAEAVMNQVAIRIKEHLSQWTEGRLKAEICVFSSAHGIVGKTERAEEFLDLWKGSV